MEKENLIYDLKCGTPQVGNSASNADSVEEKAVGKFVRYDSVSYEDTLKFGKNQGNRREIKSHVAKLKKQCLTSFAIMPPITVNVVTYNIIDGQHRLRAYQELVEQGVFSKEERMKVMFVEVPIENEKKAIIAANTNSKGWSLDDFIKSYCNEGNKYYVGLENWCDSNHPLAKTGKKEKGLKFRYGAAIITGRRCSSELKSGDFTFTEEELKRAEEVHAEMLEIIELFGLKGKGAWIESLACSWIAARNQHTFKVWFRELKKKKSSFLKLPKDNSRDWDAIFGQVHLAIDKKGEE